jgi:hypothetical protein
MHPEGRNATRLTLISDEVAMGSFYFEVVDRPFPWLLLDSREARERPALRRNLRAFRQFTRFYSAAP